MHLPKKVRMVEVSPRDGLQNEEIVVPVELKVKFIQRLTACGFSTIEAGSFVSPQWVPQMAGSDLVLQKLPEKQGVHYSVLVPNLQGFHDAVKAGAKEVAVFAAASESFSQKNINCSIDTSLEHFAEIVASAKQQNILVRGYISCCLGCPYEGTVDPKTVVTIAGKLLQMGCYEISLGDTIGVGTPLQAQNLVNSVALKIPVAKLAAHFHDTYGQALANILAVLECGIEVIDSSVAGLGGCPYAQGAAGNVASEDVLYMLNGLDISTGVSLDKLIAVGEFICQTLQHPTRSKVAFARQSA